jgi:hypothetical protein
MVKKDMDRRADRRKNDEDIAERISGGVRLERPSAWRARGVAHDQPPPPATSHPDNKRRRRGR